MDSRVKIKRFQKRLKSYNRQQKVQNTLIHKISVIVMPIIILICLAVSGFMLYRVYQHYQVTKDWHSEQNQELKLSEQSPDLLYDDNKISKENKRKFNLLYNKIYDENKNDFKAEFSGGKLKKLSTILKGIDKNTNQTYLAKYNNLKTRYDIQKAYYKLFDDSNQKILKSTTTPADIKNLNDKYFQVIAGMYADNNKNDGFANRLYKIQTNLAKDAVTYNKALLEMNEIVLPEPNPTKLVIKKLATVTHLNNFRKYLDDLIYDWENITYMNVLQNRLRSPLEAQTRQYQKFDEYLKDIQERDAEIARRKAAAEYRKTHVTVPNFIGKPKSEVEKWAKSHKIHVEYNYVATDEYDKDIVLESSPFANEDININSIFYITLSKEKPKEEVKDDDDDEKTDSDKNNNSNSTDNNNQDNNTDENTDVDND